MRTYHVTGELRAKVVAASAPSRADHSHDQLFELVRSVPQVIDGPPTGRLDLCVRVRVRAACSQELHRLHSFSVVKRTIQLQKNQRKENCFRIDCYVLLFDRIHI